MKTYYLQFNVDPCKSNEHYKEIGGALACCWVKANSSSSAFRKAMFFIEKEDWKTVKLDLVPTEVTRDNFIGGDIGLENYDKLQNQEIAIVYSAWSRDGRTTKGPIELQSSYKYDLQQYIDKLKKNKNKGRCLHYDAGAKCSDFIKAHSIQKKGLLSKIAKDGEVYGLAYDIGDLKKTKAN
jgi:hypothetical protein